MIHEDEKIASITIDGLTKQVTVVTQKQEDEVLGGFAIFFAAIFAFISLGVLPIIPLLIYLVVGKRWVWLGLFGLFVFVYDYFSPEPFLTNWWSELFILANSFSCVVIFSTLFIQSKKWWMKCIWVYLFLSVCMYGITPYDHLFIESKNNIVLFGYVGLKILFLPVLVFTSLIISIFGMALFPFDYLKGETTRFIFNEYFLHFSFDPGYKQFVKITLPFAWLSMWMVVPFYTIKVIKFFRK